MLGIKQVEVLASVLSLELSTVAVEVVEFGSNMKCRTYCTRMSGIASTHILFPPELED